MYILLGISFLLHILSILAIIVLYQRRTVERIKLPTVKEDIEALHQSMEAFIDEIEKENEELYKRILHYIQEKDSQNEERLQELQHRLDTRLDERNQGGQELQELQELQESALKTNESSALAASEELASVSHSSAEGERSPSEPSQDQPSPFHNIASETVTEELDPKHQNTNLSTDKLEQVKTLYRQGFSVDHIAKVLQMGKGETQLVIHLMKQK